MVPAISETIERSSPAKALSKDDLPTFGRPIKATLRYPSCTCARPTSGRCATTLSNRSPLPRPCKADTKYGSPNPKFHRECASDSSRSLSTLFAMSTIGFLAFLNS